MILDSYLSGWFNILTLTEEDTSSPHIYKVFVNLCGEQTSFNLAQLSILKAWL
jgi:hypothetical protein